MGGGHALEEVGWAAGHPVTAGTRSHPVARAWASLVPSRGGLRAAALAVPGALSKVLGVCQVDQVESVTYCLSLTCSLLHHLGVITGQRRPRQEPCSLVRHQVFSPQLSLSA